ncbi:hypothetical protein HY312_00950 [Candidatus Saccharibacteria bacterium]|nr:hypothetical protein [Candidatus Saccharibacteria bacterium]
MAIKQELNTLLNKKMDRKDFLKVVGVGVVAATGIGSLIRAINPSSTQTRVGSAAAPQGYGSSAYGGTKTS